MNGSPNSEENVGVGSLMPRSVPATFEVKPVMKWYMAEFSSSFEIGGSTPNASHVRKITTSGVRFATPFTTALSMNSTGYATRPFSVSEVSK